MERLMRTNAEAQEDIVFDRHKTVRPDERNAAELRGGSRVQPHALLSFLDAPPSIPIRKNVSRFRNVARLIKERVLSFSEGVQNGAGL